MQAEVTLERAQWDELRALASRRLRGLDQKKYPSLVSDYVSLRELASEVLAQKGRTLTASVSLGQAASGEDAEVNPEIKAAFAAAARRIIAAQKA